MTTPTDLAQRLHAMLTDTERQLIETVKAAEARATPGPWEIWISNSCRRITGPDGRDGGVLSAVQCRDGRPDFHGYNRDRDLDFIAATRNSVPALLAIIERLEEVASEAESRVHYCPVCKEYCNQCECWEKRIDELQSQNAELRQQLERATASHRNGA